MPVFPSYDSICPSYFQSVSIGIYEIAFDTQFQRDNKKKKEEKEEDKTERI